MRTAGESELATQAVTPRRHEKNGVLCSRFAPTGCASLQVMLRNDRRDGFPRSRSKSVDLSPVPRRDAPVSLSPTTSRGSPLARRTNGSTMWPHTARQLMLSEKPSNVLSGRWKPDVDSNRYALCRFVPLFFHLFGSVGATPAPSVSSRGEFEYNFNELVYDYAQSVIKVDTFCYTLYCYRLSFNRGEIFKNGTTTNNPSSPRS